MILYEPQTETLLLLRLFLDVYLGLGLLCTYDLGRFVCQIRDSNLDVGWSFTP